VLEEVELLVAGGGPEIIAQNLLALDFLPNGGLVSTMS
jgi:hypothetical protein